MPIPPRVSVVALRTADLVRSTGFYAALGWELSTASTATMSLFKTAGSYLLICTDELLAELGGQEVATALAGEPTGEAVLSIHVASDAEVAAAVQEAVRAGGVLVRGAAPTPLGGSYAFFADPDGHLWEVIHHPLYRLGIDGPPPRRCEARVVTRWGEDTPQAKPRIGASDWIGGRMHGAAPDLGGAAGRALAVPRRLADPGAVHQVRAHRGVRRRRRTRAFLSSPGVDLTGEQQTKTALEFFSRSLKASADASPRPAPTRAVAPSSGRQATPPGRGASRAGPFAPARGPHPALSVTRPRPRRCADLSPAPHTGPHPCPIPPVCSFCHQDISIVPDIGIVTISYG